MNKKKLVSFNKNKNIPHSFKKTYNLIADVKAYPDFLPWCTDIKIIKKSKKYILTKVKVGFQNINETYTCKVLLYPERISLDYISGPFEYLEIDWKFKKISKKITNVSFFCNFKFRSVFLRLFTNFFLETAIEKMVDAFEKKLNN